MGLTFFFAALLPQSANAAKSLVYDYDGNVVVMRDGIGQTLKSDFRLENGDVLKTDANGSIDILMNQLAGVRFQTASECVIVDTKTSSMHLQLNEGRALVNLKEMPNGGVFTMETPIAVIETNLITQFSCVVVNTEEQSSTVVAVRKGGLTVQVKSSGAEIRVLETQAVDINSNTFISPPRQMNEDEVKLLDKVNSIIITADEDA
jgi:hypothetical protein